VEALVCLVLVIQVKLENLSVETPDFCKYFIVEILIIELLQLFLLLLFDGDQQLSFV